MTLGEYKQTLTQCQKMQPQISNHIDIILINTSKRRKKWGQGYGFLRHT